MTRCSLQAKATPENSRAHRQSKGGFAEVRHCNPGQELRSPTTLPSRILSQKRKTAKPRVVNRNLCSAYDSTGGTKIVGQVSYIYTEENKNILSEPPLGTKLCTNALALVPQLVSRLALSLAPVYNIYYLL